MTRPTVLAVALVAAAAAGQEPTAARPVGGPAPAPSGKKQLVFVLRTDAGLEPERLTELFTKAKENATKKDPTGQPYNIRWAEVVTPEPIDADTYQTLQAFTREGGIRDILRQKQGLVAAPQIRVYPGTEYEIALGSRTRILTKLTFLDGNGNKIGEDLDPTEANPRVEVISRGLYRLTGPISPTPARYRLKYRDNGVPKEEVLDWPAATAEGYWLIELKDFEGDITHLKRVLKEHRYRTPVRQLDVVEGTTIALADLKPGRVKVKSGWSGNVFQFRFDLLRGENSDEVVGKRMYVKFPLTQKEAEEEVRTLAGVGKKGGEAVLKAVLDTNPSPAGDKDAKLTPTMPARWFEVPKVIGAYQRDIPAENFAGWQAIAEDRSWRVSVYELDPGPREAAGGAARTVISVYHENPVRPDQKDKLLDAIDEQEKEWITGVLNRSDPPAPKK